MQTEKNRSKVFFAPTMETGTKKEVAFFFAVGLEPASVRHYKGFFARNRMNVS